LNLELVAPEISLVFFSVLVIVLDLFVSRKGWLAAVSVTGLMVSAALAVGLWGDNPQSTFNGMLAVDNFSVFFKVLFSGTAILVSLSSTEYISRFRRFQGEYYALIMLSTLGMMLMASGTELITLFVSLELVNLALYALVSFLKDSRSSEASLKYILLSATASAVLLFGMALIFGFTGTTDLSEIARVVQAALASSQTASAPDVLTNPGLFLGIVMFDAGLDLR
jgi:NADH-quinone oxidoreductase subunit N